MSEQSKGEGRPLPQLGALLVVWLLFYGVLMIHGLTTSYVERLAKAWTVQDNAEGAPGAAQATRASLELSANRIGGTDY
jgi:hypothetical protein